MTGGFTQEDPIGLAGGLNLYGFANADPLNAADPFGLATDTVDYDSPATKEKVEAAAKLSPSLAESLEDAQLDPTILVHFRQGVLLGPNPGLVDPKGWNPYGQRVFEITFDFGKIEGINKNLLARGIIGPGEQIQESDVIGHEIFAHLQPRHEFSLCSDFSGCARDRENRIRREMGHKPRKGY